MGGWHESLGPKARRFRLVVSTYEEGYGNTKDRLENVVRLSSPDGEMPNPSVHQKAQADLKWLKDNSQNVRWAARDFGKDLKRE